VLAQKDRDGIGFVAGRTAGHPDAHLVGGALVLEQHRYDEGLECAKGDGIAEKTGNPDQQVAEQGADLFRICAQPLDIIFELCRLDYLHAALDPALKGWVLVFAEIVPGSFAQEPVNVR